MNPVDCIDVVELVTDYLEHQLDADRTVEFEAHLRECDGCDVYVDQMRTVVADLGRIETTQLAPEALELLTAAFRDMVPDDARLP
jgi:anti-sigma factor RsiW